MKSVAVGDRVVSIADDGQSVEVHKVFKTLGKEIQVQDASGRISTSSVRVFDEDIVNQIRQKEQQLAALKREIRALYEKLEPVG